MKFDLYDAWVVVDQGEIVKVKGDLSKAQVIRMVRRHVAKSTPSPTITKNS